MLYTCANDFFKQAASARRLSREEEKEVALKMQAGDEEAKQTLIESYLPAVASCVRRWSFGEPSLEIVYRFLKVLENSMTDFDFQQDNHPFERRLVERCRREMSRYIADEGKS